MLTTDFQQIIDLSEVQTTETNCDHFYGFNTQKNYLSICKKINCVDLAGVVAPQVIWDSINYDHVFIQSNNS